jgi:hypothetical protein
MLASRFRGNSDDNRLTNRQIEFWIQYYRAKGVNEYTNYGKDIDPVFVQDLGTLKLEDVDKSDTSCPAVEWGCTIKKVTIPKLASMPKNRALLFVGLIDKQTPIVIDDADVHKFARSTRFGKRMHRGYLIGQTLYIVIKDGFEDLKYINVRGVFEDPKTVSTIPGPGCEAVCFNPNTAEYPMPMSMVDYIVKNIVQTELNIGLRTQDDEINNARNENAQVK